MTQEFDSLAPSQDEESLASADAPVVKGQGTELYHNVEEQALILAAANEDTPTGQVGETAVKNVAPLHQGQAAELRKPIVRQEFESYIAAAKDTAETQASLGRLDAAYQALTTSIEIEKAKQAELSKTQQHLIVSRRATEHMVSQDPRNFEVPISQMEPTIAKWSELSGLRSILNEKNEKEGPLPWLDIGSFVAQSFPPFLWAGFIHQATKVARKATGENIPMSLNPMEMVQAIHDKFDTLDQHGRDRMLEVLEKETYGILGLDNKVARRMFFDMVANLTSREAVSQRSLNTLGLGLDIYGVLGMGMALVNRLGRPAKVIKETAGSKVAGELIADSMAHGTEKAIGLVSEEAVGAAIAAGNNPYHLDPSKISGVSGEVHDRLKKIWDAVVTAETERLSSAGIPEAEKEIELARLRASYSKAARKEIVHVEFGGGPSTERNKMTVIMANEDGRAFHDMEEARAFARRQGLADDAWHLVEVQAHDQIATEVTTKMVKTFHGGDSFASFREEFIGKGSGGNSLGHGFYSSLVREMAERFARGRMLEGKAATLYELSLPDAKHFLDFDKKLGRQSSEVREALASVLSTTELMAARNQSGREIYNVLKNRAGGEAGASSLLEKSGIVGNTGTTMARDREFVVFSEEVMNKSILKRTKVEGGETAPERAARKAAENVQDEDAAKLMHEFGREDSDAVRMAIQTHKGYSDMSFIVNKDLVKPRRTFDYNDRPLWVKGEERVQFSQSFSRESEQWTRGLVDMLGLQNENVVFVHADELDKLAFKPEFASKQGQRNVDALKRYFASGAADGVYQASSGKSGTIYHVIALKPNPDSVIGVKTLTHEVAHLFDFVFLQTLQKPARDAIMKDFVSWLARNKKGDQYNLPAIMERVVNPDLNKLDIYELLGKIHSGEIDATRPATAKLIQSWEKWITDFSEYAAEQMSRHLIQRAEVVTLGEKTWSNWASQMQRFYKEVTKRMRELFGRDVLRFKEEDAWKQLLDTHIADVRAGKFRDAVIGLDPSNMPPMVMPGEGMRIAGKPHIIEEGVASVEAGKPHITPKIARKEYHISVSIDDPVRPAGTYDPQDIASMPWIVADPRHGVSVDAMAGRVIGVHQTARTRRDLMKLIEEPLGKLNKSERQRVLAVLEEGDQASFAGGYGKEFTAPELFARDFTQNEVEAYLSVRQSRMLNYFIHNKEMVDALRAKGMMEVEVFGQGKSIGRALSLEEAKLKGKINVYDVTSKSFVSLEADAAYLSGKRLIEIQHGARVDGQEVTRILATEKEATVRRIYQAVAYRPGEFARIYNDPYFIRMAKNSVVDGAKKAVEYPVRTAATQKEATEFIDAVMTGRDIVLGGGSLADVEKAVGKFYSAEDFVRQVNDGELKDMTGLRFHFTRQIDDYLGQSLEAASHQGKLFTSDRGEHILSADRTRSARANILNPYESLSAEMTMVSHFASVNEWKEAQIQRWMNTFGDMLGSARTGNDMQDFFAAAGAKFSHVTGKQGLFAERTHAYIMRQIGIQTQEHKWWQALMRRVGEGTMPYAGEGVGAVIRDANPLNFIRSINHHFTLGLLNISQLIVQANGMSIAAAIHPIYGAKAAAMFPALRLALMSDNPEVWARISKVMGEDVGRLAQAIRKTGLIDNLRTTSLHNIEDGKLDIFASMPRRMVGKLVDKTAFFFNRGEEFSRVVSFDIARREWEKLNPGGDFLSPKGLQWIMSKSDDYTQNMTRANLARWQEGIMSIPTQFLQYNIKLAQNIVSGLVSGGGKGRGFTRSEALKALAGSIAFYGAAGMGISNMMGEWISEDARSKMPPLARTAIGQGVIAAAFKALVEATTGDRFEVALGTRLGSINFFTDLVYSAFYDPKTVWQALLGPTKSTGDRLAVFADVAGLWRRQEKVTMDDVGKGALEIFTEQASALRNAAKAYYIHQGGNVLVDRKGQRMAQLSTPEVWAQAVGLQPSAAYDAYQLLQSRHAHFQALDDIAMMVFKTQKGILQARNAGDADRAERMTKALSLMFPQNYSDFVHVMNLVREKLAPYDNEFQKLMNEHALKGSNFAVPLNTTSPDVRQK